MRGARRPSALSFDEGVQYEYVSGRQARPERFTIITLLVLAGALAAALVLVTTGTFGSGVASGDDDPAGTTTEPGWRYIAEVVCVPELGPAGPVLVPGGKYRTAVNVANPWDWDVALVKWLTLSRDQGIPPIVGSQVHTDLLPPGASFDVDCTDMRDTYGLPDGAKVPGGKRHLWIEANDFLQVNTVYTTKNAKGGGISIEVEEVYPWPVFGPPVNPGRYTTEAAPGSFEPPRMLTSP